MILAYAHKNGITTLDTAAAYGESEHILGQALRETGLEFKIISKLPPVQTVTEVRKTVEASLEKLQQQRLHGYMLHNFSIFKDMPKVMQELCQLQKEGIIKNSGVSLYHPEEALELLDKNILFNISQFPYNIFDRRFESILGRLKEHQVEVHTRSAFLQGLFFMVPDKMPPYFQSIIPEIRQLQQMAQQSGIPLEAMLLCFVLANPEIDKVTIGVNSLEDLKRNLSISQYWDDVQKMIPILNGYSITDENILLPYNWKTS